MRQEGAVLFAQVPWALQDDPKADAATIATYAALQRFADFGKTTGCRVSDRLAAKKAGLGRRTFIDRRNRLRQMGWISWVSGKANHAVNTYIIHRSPEAARVHDVQTPKQELHTPSARLAQAPVQDVPTTKSPPTENQVTKEPTTRATLRVERSGESNPRRADSGMTHLLDLVRKQLYVPDGAPPANWRIARDASILSALRRLHTDQDIEAAILGLGLLRDFPGVFGDPIDWLKPGEKATLRAIYYTKSGARQMFGRARDAYWRQVNTRPSNKDGPSAVHVSRALRGILETVP